MLEVVHRHEKLAPESASNLGLWHRFLEPVSEACVRGLSLLSFRFFFGIFVARHAVVLPHFQLSAEIRRSILPRQMG